jgi:hypothetical protein
MTEPEWLAATRPADLIEFIFFDTEVSDRRLRLFSCACAQRVCHLTVDEAFAGLVELAEAYADERVAADVLKARNSACTDRYRELHRSSSPAETFARMAALRCGYWASERKRDFYQPHDLDFPYPLGAAQDAWGAVSHAGGDERGNQDGIREDQVQVAILQDIFGNPFRPVTFLPEWRTSTVLALAQQMYDSRDFGAMPILADALQDAGCDSENVLNHCRSGAVHVRGCWVVDLALGKA